MNNLNSLKVKSAELAKQSLIVSEARTIARNLKHEIREEKTEIILELMEKFIENMKTGWERDNYIRGGYSDEFTKFVARRKGTSWWGPTSISDKHTKAQRVFNDALHELNRVFVAELSLLDSNELRNLSEKWNLKNLANDPVEVDDSYDEDGFNCNSYHRNGTLYDDRGFNISGHHQNGTCLDDNGFDVFGDSEAS